MDFSFFEEVNEVVQEEPSQATDAETLGLLAAIGIEIGKPFAPDPQDDQRGSYGMQTSCSGTARARAAIAGLPAVCGAAGSVPATSSRSRRRRR
jgi:hypothetical protein